MSDDARDLAASQAGDHAAFARLYDRHAAVVLSLCRNRCVEDAEDATQETFVRAYHMLSKLDGSDGFRPWLYAIARRVCSERRRAAQRRNHHEEKAMVMKRYRPAARPSIGDSVDRAEQLDQLGAALEALPEDERLAIHLFYLDEDPVASAASALGLSHSGFYKLLARARNRLASQLREAPNHERLRATAKRSF